MFETKWQLFKTIKYYVGSDGIKFLWNMLKQNYVTDEETELMLQDTNYTYKEWNNFMNTISKKLQAKEIDRREEQLKRLEEMKSFKKNWNGYDGEPINEKALEIAELLVKLLNPVPIVTPTGRDTIQLEWENKNGYLELEISKDSINIFNTYSNDNIIVDGEGE